MITPDISAAEGFLARFDYQTTTVQTLQDDKTQGGGALAFSGKLTAHAKLLTALTQRNSKRGGVFFMVNEGDGQIHEGYKTCRSSASVTTLKALFVDTDGQPTDPLLKLYNDLGLFPHMVVESSPGRYHYYYLIEPLDATDRGYLFKWQAVQTALAACGNYDSTMRDVARVLRIPGFYHNKKDPFLVKVIANEDHAPYDLHAVYADLRENGYITEELLERKLYQEPTKPLTEGQRHGEANAFIGHILNDDGISQAIANSPAAGQEAALKAAIGHIVLLGDKWPDGKAWLPGGSRHNELLKQVSDLVARRRVELLPTIAPSPIIADNRPAQFDPNLFLQAPGLIGKVTQDFHARYKSTIPQFDYAAARSLVGFLKSFRYMTKEKKTLPPVDYLFCLAATGRGKSFSKDLAEEILVKLGFGRSITQTMRSNIGLDRALHEAAGRLIIVHNEAHQFLEQMRETKADYIKAVNPWMLKLYDAYKAARASSGITGDKKVEEYNHAYAQVSYLGYGVPVALDTVFDAKALHSGLMARFLIILADNVPIPELERDDAVELPSVESLPCFQLLKDLATESGELDRKKIELLGDIQSDDLDDDGDKKRKASLERQRSILELEEQSKRNLIKLPYTDAAWVEREKFHAHLTKIRDQSEILNGFYSRTGEHVIRAALADADNGVIEKRHIEFAIQSVMMITDRLKKEIGDNLDVGGQGRLMNRALRYLKEMHAKSNTPWISERELINKFDSAERMAARDAVQGAIEDGRIHLTPNPKSDRPGRKVKRGLTLVSEQ